jgi:hypothetical protein
VSATSLVKITSYTRHKAPGLAVVRLNGRDPYLGNYGSAASKREYDRLVGEWLVGRHRLAMASTAGGHTMNELAIAYWNYSKELHG